MTQFQLGTYPKYDGKAAIIRECPHRVTTITSAHFFVTHKKTRRSGFFYGSALVPNDWRLRRLSLHPDHAAPG